MKKKKPNIRPKLVNSRKAQRQNERRLKKINRHEHYTNRKQEKIQNNLPGRFVRRPLDDEEDLPVKNKKQKPQPTNFLDILSKERNKEMKEANKLKSQMEEQRRKLLVQENEDEDKVIKKLEKQLGLKKSKNKNSYFADDGLDYLLQICDRATQEQVVAAEKHLANVDGDSDFEDDLAAVTGKETKSEQKTKKRKEAMNTSIDGSESEEDEDMDDGGSNMSDDYDDALTESCDEGPGEAPVKNRKDKKTTTKAKAAVESSDEASVMDDNDESDYSGSDEEPEETAIQNSKKLTQKSKQNSKMSDDGESIEDDGVDESHFGDSDEDDECDINNVKEKEKPDTWEDIYGRKRDKDGNVIKETGAYIPPQFRNKGTTSNAEITQLKRQIKSVLNKLSGSNFHWASSTIENLYSSKSRNSVNNALSELWIEALIQITMAPDRLITEYVALVAILHANIGNEIGAHFLEVLVKKFNEMLQSAQDVENKQLDNLVAALSYLYNFKIFNSNLIYDIFNRLLEDLCEKNIDCVLVSLRIVGGVLRKEEPLSLKTFIHDTQGKVATIKGTATQGSRLKFLLEVLLAVKNNNLTKIPNYDPTYCEELKKNIKNIIRRGNYITALNIRLEDLLKADERGKWWVVGSAWEGNLRPQEHKSKPKTTQDEKLLELARKQRMNTEVRRSIFCVIMSAEDYMDAFEKLDHLGLRGDQQREIIHVLLACCLQEAKYNPYYAVLARKLCEHERKFQLSIQYTVWDKIKDLESLSKQSASNLAQFLTHLIMDTALPLSVLKVIEFSDLKKSTVKFMRQILLAIIMNNDLQASLAVFQRISASAKLHMFRESLRLFIQHFLVRNSGKKTNVLSDGDMETLKERTVDVEKLLTINDNKLKF